MKQKEDENHENKVLRVACGVFAVYVFAVLNSGGLDGRSITD